MPCLGLALNVSICCCTVTVVVLRKCINWGSIFYKIACASSENLEHAHRMQADQRLRCPSEDALHPRLPTECHASRKEGNDQESIQCPNTLRPSHQRERRTYLKQRHHNQNTTNRKPKGQFLSQKLAKRLFKMKNSPGHTKTVIEIVK